MSVNTTCPDYNYYFPSWQLCRDTRDGERKVKEAGQVYVPKLDGQSDDDYAAYLRRGSFFGAMGRSVDGLTGLLFRKNMVKEGLSEAMAAFCKDVTARGESLSVFAGTCTDEDITVGRGGILVDFTDSTAGLTQAEAEAIAARPFMSLYKAEQIINWQKAHVQGYGFVLSRIVLLESYEYFEEGDPYTVKTSRQYRDLYLDENGLYVQALYRENGDDAEGLNSPIEEYRPLMNGSRMDFIPFVFFNDINNDSEVRLPPLASLAQLNIHHFNTDVDLAHALHYVGLPTPYAFGVTMFNDGTASLKLGPQSALISSTNESRCGYMQVDSSGFGVLESREKHLEEQMAKVGARMLTPDKASAEATDTLIIRNQGEYSVLTRIACSVSSALTIAVRWCARWLGEADYDNIIVKLNTDFNPKRMDANELIALTKAVQSGVISYETFFWNLQQGEIIQDSRNCEQERDEIEMDKPMFAVEDADWDKNLTKVTEVSQSTNSLEEQNQ